jgi:hypothetical protein
MASRSETRQRVEADADVPWVREGILAGVLGAATIAILFFVVDLANGRPLWTPNALGAALFLGQIAPADAPISPALIGGYTVIHGWVFVSVALIVAFLLSGNRLPGEQPWHRILALAVPLFVGFSVVFFVFGLLRGPEAARPVGYGWLVLINALAALVMAGWLVTRLQRPPA